MSYVKMNAIGDIVVLHPKGEYTGGDETDELAIAMEEAFEAGGRKLVVNLHNVSYLNATAINYMLEASKGLTQRSGRLVLSNVQDRMHAIFLEAKLILDFETYDTEKEAITSFSDWVAPEPLKTTNGTS